MRPTRALAAVLIALALAGGACADDDAVRAGADDEPTTHDCGAFELGQGGVGPAGYASGRRCLLDAFEAGSPAVLRLDVPTVEGAPIHQTFEVTGVHEVLLTHDNRDDPLRGADRFVQRCTELRAGDQWLVVDECTTEEEVPRGASQEYEATAMVIEYAGQEPQLCLGPQLAMYPPSCTGPRLVGWDWDAVDDEQATEDRTWGTYRVRGNYVDDTFTLTRPAEPLPVDGPGALPPSAPVQPSTPCPEPDGGWRVVDAATTSDAQIQAANLYAQGQPDYGGFWVDQSRNPVIADGYQPADGMWQNDPTTLVVNASFTGDLARHERELREVWGGALCVSQAVRGWAELTRIAGELADRPGIQSTSPDPVHAVVRVGVVVDDGLQERMDAEFGEGAVVVDPVLQPVD